MCTFAVVEQRKKLSEFFFRSVVGDELFPTLNRRIWFLEENRSIYPLPPRSCEKALRVFLEFIANRKRTRDDH